jgi:hypothetical protein
MAAAALLSIIGGRGRSSNGISGIGRAMAVRIASLAAGACARLRSELRRSRLAF